MKEFLTDKINNLPASATLAMAAKARELKNKGIDIIGLSLGEPDFNVPEFIKKAANKAINDNYNSYTPVDGYLDLKEAISNKFFRDNNLNYDTNQIVVSTGAKQSIANVIQAMVNPGEEVILLAPFWVSYSAIVEMAEGVPVVVNSDITTDFKVSAKNIEEKINAKTKMIVLNSPNNPSGTVYTEKELRNIATVLEKYPDIFILSDEIYEHINYGVKHFSFAEIDSMYNRTITVNGVAKAFAMTGWRIGYAAGRKDLILAMMKIQGQSTSNPTSISQYAALAGLNGDRKFLEPCLKAFNERKNLVVKGLNSIDGISCLMPKGAFYAYPNVSGLIGKKTQNGKSLSNDTEVVEWILEEAKVAAVPGSAFGLEPYFRVSYATSTEDLKIAIQNLKNSVSELI